ncbi:hypothetical protein [Acinetobacter sp.]|uniref:hypothetical protein n=1 Tax=Acinetobacter sp. TaxID=472 RepID=UPI0012C29125|nr:hypothetical protein [Acinetobacter sp.]MPS62123.1 hypothetical protein [Acinetobacter sp.]
MSNLITADQLRDALPDSLKKSVSQEVIDHINKTLSDPDMYETYRDNLLNYTSVMQEGRFRVTDYVNAVKYVSNKLLGHSNFESYIRTFPDRYQSWLARKMSQKDMSAHVAGYNKSKLVNLIYEQTQIPTWVLNQDLFQKALNVQADLMMNAKSEMVRTNAANSLLNHLKPPQTQQVQLDLTVKESSAIDELRRSTMEYVAAQKQAIRAGAITAKDAAEARVIEAEVRDVS